MKTRLYYKRTFIVILIIFTVYPFLIAQNVGISDNGATPNSSAMLDIVSPATGDGKGLLIPRVTEAQRTTADSGLAGGLLDDSGNLRGGIAQGLLIYQTNGSAEGFYYNTSTNTTPNWVYIGTGSGSVSSITAGAGLDGGTVTTTGTISLPNTGTSGTYTKVTTDAKGRVSSGTDLVATDIPDLDAVKITTGTITTERGGLGTDVSAFSGLAYIDSGSATVVPLTISGKNLIDDASVADQRTTLGLGSIATQNIPYTLQNSNGNNGQILITDGAGLANWGNLSLPIVGSTITIGDSATTSSNGVAVGVSSNGNVSGVALGYQANSYTYGAALGYKANGYDNCVAVGYGANGYCGSGPYSGAVSVGYRANSYSGSGKYSGGVALGYYANARHNFNENNAGAVAIGHMANSFIKGAAVGYGAAGYNKGVALGYLASGSNYGVGIGYMANGAIGSYGTAIGYMANGGGSKNFTFAKGAYSKTERYNEEWKSSDGYENKFGYGKLNFHGTTTTSNATEIFLGGTTNKRFILKDNSTLTFQGLVTGINANTGDSSGWRYWGVIERRSGVATTTLVGSITIDGKTQGGLTTSPNFTADTTNGCLKLQVTGVNANSVLWNATISYSEIRESSMQ